MSGLGKRFAAVGYPQVKPLIQVCGKPLIEYVVSMFPGKHEFIFICNQEHLQTTNMISILTNLKPNCKIIPVERYAKGPVFDVSHIFDEIKNDEEIMVSYCDYFMDWDFEEFQKQIHAKNYDAAVPCYIGFHPHLLHGSLYAGVLTDGKGTMTAIKEKHCFTERSVDCHQSAGAYYFRRGSDLKKYFSELMKSDMNLKGEYYASTPFELLVRDKMKIFVPEVKHFIQFGTPEDLEEFEGWARYFAKLWNIQKSHSDIPTEREKALLVPVPLETAQFTESKIYWEPVFKNLFNKNK